MHGITQKRFANQFLPPFDKENNFCLAFFLMQMVLEYDYFVMFLLSIRPLKLKKILNIKVYDVETNTLINTFAYRNADRIQNVKVCGTGNSFAVSQIL